MSRRSVVVALLCSAFIGMVVLGGCARTEADPARSADESQGESAPAGPADDREWTVQDSAAWPGDLVPAAEEYVASCSVFERMTLFAPQVADTSDGATWVVFTVGATDQPDYERLVVVMKREPGQAWTGVNAGTGMGRTEVLPEELSQAGFGTPPLEDR